MNKLQKREVEYKATHYLNRFLEPPYNKTVWDSIKEPVMQEIENEEQDIPVILSKYISEACEHYAKIQKQDTEKLPWMCKYYLSVDIFPDSDFGSDHPFFDDDDDYNYHGAMGWDDPEQAVSESVRILTEIKQSMDCKDFCQEDFEEIFDLAIERIQQSWFAYVTLGGNYEGTKIQFGKMREG